jgi:hypothetical protein
MSPVLAVAMALFAMTHPPVQDEPKPEHKDRIIVTSTELIAGAAAIGGVGYAIGYQAHTERTQPVAELKSGLVFLVMLPFLRRRRLA